MRNGLRFLLLLGLSLGSACGDDEAEPAGQSGEGGSSGMGNTGGDTATRLPPDDETACMLRRDESTYVQVRAVLGEPTTDEVVMGEHWLEYLFTDGTRWSFGFDENDVWSSSSLMSPTGNPSCWTSNR